MKKILIILAIGIGLWGIGRLFNHFPKVESTKQERCKER